MIGKVLWYNATKGYGFIASETGGNDVFVHRSAVTAAGLSVLREGDRVEFREELSQQRPGKFAAAELRLLEPATAAAKSTNHRDEVWTHAGGG